MKKLKFTYIIVFLLLSTFCHAQDARYIYKPLNKESCRVTFTASGVPQQKFIVVKIVADKGITFTDKPEMVLYTLEGDSIKLTGKNLNPVDVSDGKYRHGLTGVYGYAKFPISANQIEKMLEGIKGIRLSTMPWVHQREFKSEKVWRRLYTALIK